MKKAAIAIILNNNNEVLLGLSTSSDFRKGKLCFVGGGIEQGESILDAAIRETQEEVGLTVTPRKGEVYRIEGNDRISFVVCDYNSGEITPNDEFTHVGWYGVNNLPKNILDQNKQIIEKLFTKSL